MFVSMLSQSLISLCRVYQLDNKMAARLCDVSPQYFSEMKRGVAIPSIVVLEKLCVGFQKTPNDLLIPVLTNETISFRTPLAIRHVRYINCMGGPSKFAICPRCGITLERDYQAYCDRCGQCLDWSKYKNAAVIR